MDKEAVLNEIYQGAYNDEMEKIAKSGKLVKLMKRFPKGLKKFLKGATKDPSKVTIPAAAGVGGLLLGSQIAK